MVFTFSGIYLTHPDGRSIYKIRAIKRQACYTSYTYLVAVARYKDHSSAANTQAQYTNTHPLTCHKSADEYQARDGPVISSARSVVVDEADAALTSSIISIITILR